MEKKYNPKQIEEAIYKFWEEGNYFEPRSNSQKENYCIMMPPPNITGKLHLGHAFQQTIMDILIRYQRMQGKNTLWKIGFDHAGIATQILVEQQIYNQTKKNNNHRITYNELIENIWKWKKKSEKIITYQMKRLGNSVDWKSKSFTMDSNMSYAVREAFIRLYQDNLIYRGKKLVNWDVNLQTAISDLEVSNKKIQSSMWYIRYLFDNTNNIRISNNVNYLVIATTRPETMLGDTAVAVHPNDPRYKHLKGQYVISPVSNRKIPIIFDKYVSMNKETGCVKITPAHDFNDYIIGKKHKLPMINIFSFNRKILTIPEIFDSYGQINNQLNYTIPKIFHNLDYNVAREKIITECKKLNLIHNIQNPYNIMIPYNHRTNSIIEPMLTNQWYIRTKKLAEKAIKAVELGLIKFVPHQYENMYFSWMKNIQDWCISRQIHWGHRIPVWYDNNKKIYVGHHEQDIRTKNNLNNNVTLHKENDVLDTWFSSSLWTFSNLGWPKNTKLLNTFHPTNIIVSGFDIIFFWIARMIMLTMYFIKDNNGNSQVPFKTIFITGLIRDKYGKKMSKSEGNVIDPLDMIDGISNEDILKKNKIIIPKKLNNIISDKNTKKNQFPNGILPHGADAVRFTLTALASSGRDIHWDMQRLTGYRNFCNKLWNASKFILMHTKNNDFCKLNVQKNMLSLPDRWIITKFHQTIKNFSKELENLRFDKAAKILYEFVWNQFCDWYIELIKPIIFNENALHSKGTHNTLITLLDSLLRLSHPIIPFITEKIWQEVKITTGNNENTIMYSSFPKYNSSLIDSQSIIDLEWIQKIIINIRNIRTNFNITYNTALEIIFRNLSTYEKKLIIENNDIISKIVQIKKIYFSLNKKINSKFITIKLNQVTLLILIPINTFNKNLIINKFNKDLSLINKKIEILQLKLNNRKFITKASKNIIIKEKEKLKNFNKIKDELLHKYDTMMQL